MERAGIEQVIRAAYAARASGDLDGMMRHFSEGASFTIAGSRDASPVTRSVYGRAAIRETLAEMTAAFEFEAPEILRLVVDGSEAAVHWRIRVRATATGREADTEIVDLVGFEDDKIRTFRQFADTAVVLWLLGPDGAP